MTLDKRLAGTSGLERLAWRDVTSFDDGSTAYVRLQRREPRRRDFYRLTIPTPSDETRRAVLELLERFGIPRAES